MAKSPGHEKWPEHRVDEKRVETRVVVEVDGEVIADSDDVINVQEDGCPDRFYFPRSDVEMTHFEKTATVTQCPFKGTATYYTIRIGSTRLDDAAWSYEQPYEEHSELAGRLVFYHEKNPAITIRR